nr:glycosyltransferase [uncultured Pedobacter sp.]
MRKKILLFPLANVLGHLSRTLALAEEFCKREQEVYVAASGDYGRLLPLADPGITFMSSLEMYADATKKFCQISYSADGGVNELELIRASTLLDNTELQRRSKRLKAIIARDTKIIEQVKPDAIVVDYHFAPLLIAKDKQIPLFCISHQIGYPSVYKRAIGKYPYPFDEHITLVPGISAFEISHNEHAGNLQSNWITCGMFSWQGWQKITHTPPKNDIFLFFGSTGCTGQLTPWFITQLQSRYELSYPDQSGSEQFLDLGAFLKQTSLIICHGGHETVMECIRQKKPMIIIPNNLEQLEIGRRVEELGLGILIAQTYNSIAIETIVDTIERLRNNATVSASLEQFAAKLDKTNGAAMAADIIINQLCAGAEHHPAETTLNY